MEDIKLLRRIEGLHTIETLQKELNLTKQSTINLISKLRKEEYITLFAGGGKKKRIYRITARKQRKRQEGMFDIINKYSPNMKIREWYDHQVHGIYGPEEALIDALQTQSFRLILASMRLFNHIKDWKKLYILSKEKNCWQKVGALYDVSRLFFKVKKMPERYRKRKYKKWIKLTQLKKKNFPKISEKWHVYISFNKYDLKEI